ncbi:MAG TPA: TIGR03619 family F420-dependent LLM class oxidoreductase [Nitrososphaeraceae archaeon]|jgi:probable F420-dependent oxidoreductase
MKVGILLPVTGQQATRENITQVAKDAENEGFDSLWVLERLLWPLTPQTPYPATPDGSLPTQYQNVLDPLVTLSYVAANTNKISLGTSVVDMLFHNPVILARSFASLDILSNGRSICGLGLGWSKDEYDVSNIPFMNKGKRADEMIDTLKRIWTSDEVQFTGEYYKVPPSKIGPKPLQKPHMPIYLGGFSQAVFSRIIKYDLNGWLSVLAGPFEYLEKSIKTIKDLAKNANKDQNKFRVILLTYPNIANSSHSGQGQRFPLTGTIDEIGSDIQKIKQMEVDHIVFGYNFVPVYDKVSNIIDITKQLSKFAR